MALEVRLVRVIQGDVVEATRRDVYLFERS